MDRRLINGRMLAAAGVHIWQNRLWFKNLIRGRWNLFRLVNTLIDLAMMLVGAAMRKFLFK